MNRQNFSEIIKEIKESDQKKVKVAVTDIDGILRGKYLNKDKFLGIVEDGFGFCNVVFGWDSHDVCYDNTSYTGWQSGYPDALASLDLSTYRRVPWDNNVPFFLGEMVKEDKTALEICPRQILKKVIKRANDLGFDPMCGMEFEWFNFKETPQSLADKDFTNLKPLTPGMFGYSLLRSGINRDFFNALIDEMHDFDIPLEGIHTETGPGVYEAAIAFSNALESADRATLFKTSAKEIGYRFGILPTFIARWHTDLPGCSGHIHQSLRSLETGENICFDKDDSNSMSETFKHYLAGQIHCLPEILPFLAPTINSYKRLVDGYWAPTKPNWAVDNRTVAFRVLSGSEKATRVEVRVPGSDVNPYLAMAASIASGLYGIENKLELTDEPVIGSGYNDKRKDRLPRNLSLATEKLNNSEIAKEYLGEKMVNHFVQTREWEWRQFQDSVTDWELKRYLEII